MSRVINRPAPAAAADTGIQVRFLLMGLTACAVLAGCEAQSKKAIETEVAANTEAEEVVRLIRLADEANGACRGAADADDAGRQACLRRDATQVRLRQHGWCYGEAAPSGNLAQWAPCGSRPRYVLDDTGAAAPAASQPGTWFISNLEGTNCFASKSPAERIEELRLNGNLPRTNEKRGQGGGLAVEVSIPINAGLEEKVWTYYASVADCQAAVAEDRAIPAKYR